MNVEGKDPIEFSSGNKTRGTDSGVRSGRNVVKDETIIGVLQRVLVFLQDGNVREAKKLVEIILPLLRMEQAARNPCGIIQRQGMITIGGLHVDDLERTISMYPEFQLTHWGPSEDLYHWEATFEPKASYVAKMVSEAGLLQEVA